MPSVDFCWKFNKILHNTRPLIGSWLFSCRDERECITSSTWPAHLTSIFSLQVPTATSTHHAPRWFPPVSRSGWTPAPSVAAMTARMLVTGRETVLPPARASKTAHPRRCPPRKTDPHSPSAEDRLYRVNHYTFDPWEHAELYLADWCCQICATPKVYFKKNQKNSS